jgi:hypothetical protein
MRTHNFPLRINDELWDDIKRVQQLDNQSANSILNQGARLIVKEKLQEISQQKRNRNTLQDMTA